MVYYVQKSAGMAMQLQTKRGTDNLRGAKGLVRFLQEMGLHDKVCLQSDPDTTARLFAQQVVGLRGTSVTLLEASVKKSNVSTGGVDHFAQEVTGLVRTYCKTIKVQWNKTVTAQSSILPWMVRHAAWVLNRFQPRSRNQGKTAYEAIHGRPYASSVCSFAEPVLGRLPEASVQSKLPVRWSDGLEQENNEKDDGDKEEPAKRLRRRFRRKQKAKQEKKTEDIAENETPPPPKTRNCP